MTADSQAAARRWLALPAGGARATGAVLVLVLRYLFGLFFLLAGLNKVRVPEYLFGNDLERIFTERLAELDPASFGHAFLENFGIPWHLPIAWVVTWGELAAGVGLLLGFATRASALLAIWLMFMFGIGGYYDASLIALSAIGALSVVFPTGHWLGMDREMHRRHPQSPWFR